MMRKVGILFCIYIIEKGNNLNFSMVLNILINVVVYDRMLNVWKIKIIFLGLLCYLDCKVFYCSCMCICGNVVYLCWYLFI